MSTPELTGKATAKDFVTPFDAHEQVARGPHEEAETEPLSVHSGLQAKEYEHADYPKVVQSHDEDGNLLAEPVVAKDADHEAELTGAAAAPEAEEE